MLSTEKAFDMLPTFVDIYDKLDIDGYRQMVAEELKEQVEKEGATDQLKIGAGLGLFKYIFKKSPKIKAEIFELVAIFTDKTVEEVKGQPWTETIMTFKNIFSDRDLMDFFKSAVQ